MGSNSQQGGRFVDYFVICGLDSTQALEHDQQAGKHASYPSATRPTATGRAGGEAKAPKPLQLTPTKCTWLLQS